MRSSRSARGRLSDFGHPVNEAIQKKSVTSKVWPVSTNLSGFAANALYSGHITAIPQSGTGANMYDPYISPVTGLPVIGGGEDSLWLRQRQAIELDRIEVRITGKNLNPHHAGYLNWAILSPNKVPPLRTDFPEDSPLIPLEGFFRGYGPNRAIDFSSSLGTEELNSLAINTDKYVVLYQQQTYLAPTTDSGDDVDENRSNFYAERHVVPVKRQIRYYGRKPHHCQTPLYLVVWYSHVLDESYDVEPNAWGLQFQAIAHWQEPGCKKNKLKT